MQKQSMVAVSGILEDGESVDMLNKGYRTSAACEESRDLLYNGYD